MSRVRWLSLILVILGFLSTTSVFASSDVPTTDAKDSVRLHTLQQLVEFYERQGDYEEAYRYGIDYTHLRDSLQVEAAQQLMQQYEKDFENEDLEIARVSLMKQQALIELNRMENEVQMTRLKNAQDSMAILNQRLNRQKQQTLHEIALKQLRQQEEQQQRLLAQKRARVVLLWTFITTAILVIVLCIIYLWSNLKALRRLKLERQRAEQALKVARADEEAQDMFIHQLTQTIQQPVDSIVEDAYVLTGMVKTSSHEDTPSLKKERVDDLHRQISMLLDIAGDVIEQCSGKKAERLMRTLVIGLWGLASLASPALAQNNPYGIRDDLYTYFRKADLMVQDPKVIAMSDTLLERAREAGDGLAMCLAYDLRVGHAYFGTDMEPLKRAQADQAACARATHNENYVFYGWNRIILKYLNAEDFISATEETQRYQEEAVRLNNNYGISRGHYYMGDIFRARGMNKEATEQYQQAVDYLLQTGSKSEISSAYARLGEISVENGDYDQAERYLKLGLNHAQKDYEKINPYLGIFNLYVTCGEVKKAESVIPALTYLKDIGQLMGNRNKTFMNTLVKYYLLIGDKERALATLDSIGDKHPRTKALTYAAVGDYLQALDQVYEYNRTTKAAEAITDAARLAALKADYNNRLSERSNNELALQNARMRTDQLKAEQAVGIERIRQDSLQLSHVALQEDAEEADLTLQRTEEAVRMETMAHEDQEIRIRRNILRTVAIVLLIITVFLIAKLIAHRRNAIAWTRQKKEAEEAAARAREASERKRNFLEQITHELRTPLHAVMGFSEVLCDDQLCASCSEEERADFCARIQEGADALRSLVGSTLELCDIDTGRVTPAIASCAVTSLLEELRETYSSRCAEGVYMECIGTSQEVHLATDVSLLRQALERLLDNACKFTRQGRIHLICSKEGNRVKLAVEDTGCGIPKEKAEAIFRHFEKVDSFIPGIGLGLTLCRSILTLLRGEVTLDTSYEGGSRFVITLPA